MNDAVQEKEERLDAQRNIVVSMPSPVFGDYRQQVLILEEPRLKEGWLERTVLTRDAEEHTYGD